MTEVAAAGENSIPDQLRSVDSEDEESTFVVAHVSELGLQAGAVPFRHLLQNRLQRCLS